MSISNGKDRKLCIRAKKRLLDMAVLLASEYEDGLIYLQGVKKLRFSIISTKIHK